MTQKLKDEARAGECQFCGVTNEQHKEEHGHSLHVHHIIPQSAGGSNERHNLLTVCQSCHATIEKTQGNALSHLSNQEPERYIPENYEGLIERVHELEQSIRDPDFYTSLFEGEKVHLEVVSHLFGADTVVTTDSEKAIECYKNDGARLERKAVAVTAEDIERWMERNADRLRRGEI